MLAQQVLLGKTKSYRLHPQLERFKESKNSVAVISTYLWAVFDEASARGYQLDASRIARSRSAVSIPVTKGQLEFELEHLKKKLRVRDAKKFRELRAVRLQPHPMLKVVIGDIEGWEVV